MATIAFVICVFISLMGVVGIIRPDKLIATVRRFRTPRGLVAAAAIRVLMGVALVLSAPGARATTTLRVLGIFIIVAGLFLPVLGYQRFANIIDWWSSVRPAYQRLWSVGALVFGVLVAYALLPAM